jgi:hypothetical protein
MLLLCASKQVEALCRSDATFAARAFPTGIGSSSSAVMGHLNTLDSLLREKGRNLRRSSSVVPEAEARAAQELSKHRRGAWEKVVRRMDANSISEAWDKVLGYLAQSADGTAQST